MTIRDFLAAVGRSFSRFAVAALFVVVVAALLKFVEIC